MQWPTKHLQKFLQHNHQEELPMPLVFFYNLYPNGLTTSKKRKQINPTPKVNRFKGTAQKVIRVPHTSSNTMAEGSLALNAGKAWAIMI